MVMIDGSVYRYL